MEPIAKRLIPSVVLLATAISLSTANAQCAHGDLDGSGSVALPDYAAFVDCTTGPNAGPAQPACAPVDFDADGDIDMLDFGTFQRVFGVTHGMLFPNREYGAGDGPRSVAIGDLDGDGILDLAVANRNSDNISVLLNRGKGIFGDDALYGVGDGPTSLYVGDLDGDGDLDIAVANTGIPPDFSDSVSVLLNHGDGTFAAHVPYGVEVAPRSVAVGDLDGDGDLDLAVANEGSWPAYLGTVSVLLNHGDGTFADDAFYAVGSRSSSVAIGDLDGDGDLDLVVANESSDNVSVLLNHGDGTFADDVRHGVGDEPSSVAIGDLDGDGDLDLAVVNSGYLTGYTISVLLNCGDSTFADDVPYDVGYDPASVAIGDLDGDGDLDLAVGNRTLLVRNDNFSVLLNYGDGTFADDVQYGAGSGLQSVVLGDLDGDGDLDLAAGKPSGNVSVHLNDGDGAFADDAFYDIGSTPTSVAIGDLDGDGDLDLAVGNGFSDDVSVLLNRGDGTFADDVLYAAGDGPTSLDIGDLDGDGDLDLAVANRGIWPVYLGTVSVLLNHGDGTFADRVPYSAGVGPGSLTFGDLDGDGDIDIVVANEFDNSVSVLLNHGDGSFADQDFFGAGIQPWSVAIVDLDGDGNLDLVVPNLGSANVSVLKNLGDGTFADQVLYGTQERPSSVAVGDLDGDGDLDLAVISLGTWPDYPGTIWVLFNLGDGTYADAALYEAGFSPLSFALGDLDGDGSLDLAIVDFVTNTVTVLLNRGDGTFTDNMHYGVGASPVSVVNGDLDGDGDLDLAVVNSGAFGGDYSVSVLLSGCIP